MPDDEGARAPVDGISLLLADINERFMIIKALTVPVVHGLDDGRQGSTVWY
jgi:hypothetical protein